jgi:heme exporter protein CcmD
MMHWLYMGGYWPFVWPSYLLTLIAVLLNIHLARRSLRVALQDARRRATMAATTARNSS